MTAALEEAMELCRECRRRVSVACLSEAEIVACVYFKQHIRAQIALARAKYASRNDPPPQPEKGDKGEDG